MDKSRVCVARTINLAKESPCKRKTNLLVYPKGKTPRVGEVCPDPPRICTAPLKRIRVATGDELRKMCAPRPCPCPPPSLTFFQMIFKMLGLSFKMALAGGLVYVTYDAGIWGDSERSDKLYKKICKTFAKPPPEVVVDVTEECEAQEDLICLPPPTNERCQKQPINVERGSFVMRQKWNKIISRIFTAIVGFPNNFIEEAKRIRQSMLEQADKKKKC